MSVSHPDNLKFRMNGKEPLGSDYDEQADILYVWRGEAARPAVSITSEEGHLVRLDPETGEIVGFTIFDFCIRFQGDGARGEITITVPQVGLGDAAVSEPRQFELVPA